MQQDLTRRLAEAATAEELEDLTRPLLELLEEVTGLETTYLTSIDEEAGEQLIVYARNVGDIEIPEGLRVEWSDTLCKRALDEGQMCTDNVPDVWGDSQAARDLRLQTYVSAPVRLPDGSLYGTLCGASGSRKTLDEDQQRVLSLFSRVVADQVAREKMRAEADQRASAAEERLRARARMLAMAEHELKTPLTILVGWNQLLRSEKADSLRETALDAIDGAVVRLQEQIERMLEEARAEVIARELQIIDIDLAMEAEEILQSFVATRAEGKLELALDPAPARADRSAVYQILSHLLENALKYSPDDAPITVSTGPGDEGARLRVADQGPGIPEDVNIFEPFQRGETEARGVGLGLHIVRTLTEAMGGRVSASRRPEGGSIFEVWLPSQE